MINPVSIPPDTVYDDSAVELSLGVTPTALAEGRKSGKLRFSRVGKRTLYRGEWLLAWFDAVSASELEAIPA